jgi:hypothetical protein
MNRKCTFDVEFPKEFTISMLNSTCSISANMLRFLREKYGGSLIQAVDVGCGTGIRYGAYLSIESTS